MIGTTLIELGVFLVSQLGNLEVVVVASFLPIQLIGRVPFTKISVGVAYVDTSLSVCDSHTLWISLLSNPTYICSLFSSSGFTFNSVHIVAFIILSTFVCSLIPCRRPCFTPVQHYRRSQSTVQADLCVQSGLVSKRRLYCFDLKLRRSEQCNENHTYRMNHTNSENIKYLSYSSLVLKILSCKGQNKLLLNLNCKQSLLILINFITIF